MTFNTKFFPQPNLEIKGANIFIGNEEFNLKIEIKNLYKYNRFIFF